MSAVQIACILVIITTICNGYLEFSSSSSKVTVSNVAKINAIGSDSFSISLFFQSRQGGNYSFPRGLLSNRNHVPYKSFIVESFHYDSFLVAFHGNWYVYTGWRPFIQMNYNFLSYSANEAYTDGNWHHLVITRYRDHRYSIMDDKACELNYYINATNIYSYTASSRSGCLSTIASDGELLIGNDVQISGWLGNLAHISFWKKSLDINEIQKIYNNVYLNQSLISFMDLLHYYPLTESSSECEMDGIIHDIWNNHNGVLNNDQYTSAPIQTIPESTSSMWLLQTCPSSPLPAHSSTYSGDVRGYYFQAPTSFGIISLSIPTDASTDLSTAAILRFNSGPPPEYWSGLTTNDFTRLGYWVQSSAATISTGCICVSSGQYIGILGYRGGINSYGSAPYTNSINGFSVTFRSLTMSNSLVTTAPEDISGMANGDRLGRVHFTYTSSCSCTSCPTLPPTQNPTNRPTISPTHAPTKHSTQTSLYIPTTKNTTTHLTINSTNNTTTTEMSTDESVWVILVGIFVLHVGLLLIGGILWIAIYFYKFKSEKVYSTIVPSAPVIEIQLEETNIYDNIAPGQITNNKQITSNVLNIDGERHGEGISDIKQWFDNDVELQDLNEDDKGLYINLLIENGFDKISIIKKVNNKDMIGIGITKLGHRKLILTAVARL